MDREETCLDTAKRLVSGDRNEDYGHPVHDFSRTAKIWTGVLLDKLTPGVEVTAEDVALCMIGVKMSRLCHAPKLDSIVDIAGYARTLEMVQEYREQEK